MVSSRAIWIAGTLANLMCTPALWGHVSTGGEILGRYSGRYFAVLALHVFVTLAYLLISIFHRKILVFENLSRIKPPDITRDNNPQFLSYEV